MCSYLHYAVYRTLTLLAAPSPLIPLSSGDWGGKRGQASKHFSVSSHFIAASSRFQTLSDVRAQSKDADSTLHMDWACSCWGRWWKTGVYWQINIHPRDQCKSSQWFPAVRTELMHWYTQMLHSSCFESVVFSASRFLPAPRPSS